MARAGTRTAARFSGLAIEALSAVAAFWFTVAVFWIVVGWRAMRALEGIEQSLRERQPR